MSQASQAHFFHRSFFIFFFFCSLIANISYFISALFFFAAPRSFSICFSIIFVALGVCFIFGIFLLLFFFHSNQARLLSPALLVGCSRVFFLFFFFSYYFALYPNGNKIPLAQLWSLWLRCRTSYNKHCSSALPHSQWLLLNFVRLCR